MKHVHHIRHKAKTHFAQPENLSRFIHLSLLFAIFAFLLLTNFPFTSGYTGWDNVHPEYNFWLNFKRAFDSVWQMNQGTGTYGGHGYAATLPHTIVMWLISWIIPVKYLRAVFTFLTLIVGSVGVFCLSERLLEDKPYSLRQKAALAAGLFYMLNLATLQNYYIQLEAFIIHFAALPWLILTLLACLRSFTRRNLLIFAVIGFFASAQGFIPPLFFVYVLVLGFFLGIYCLYNLHWKSFVKAFILFAITILINAYWFFPVVYYSFTRSGMYLNAYNNLLSTNDFILKNRKFGGIEDVSLLRGFYFETIDQTERGTIYSIFDHLKYHILEPQVAAIGYAIFIVIVIGAGVLIWQKKRYEHTATFASLIFTFTFLATNTFPFGQLSQLLQEIPILKQAFRVAFTKLGISVGFFFALALGVGVYYLLEKISKLRWSMLRSGAIYSFIGAYILGQMYFSFPVFSGKLLYDRTKINLPKMYWQMFDFFKKVPSDQRIANFPQGWNWGWTAYTWNYSGSGFLWYGIEQPIMDRAFDTWGKYNENYYWEISYAIYSKKFSLIPDIMEKYNVSWLMLDENVIPYPNADDSDYTSDFISFIEHSPKFTLAQTFNSDDEKVKPIRIFKVNLTNQPQKSIIISSLKEYKNIQPDYNFTQFDAAYSQNGAYYSEPSKEAAIYYPFRSLFTNRKPSELNVQIKDSTDAITFSAPVPAKYKKYTVVVPDSSPEASLSAGIRIPGDIQYEINDDSISFTIPKAYIPQVYTNKNDKYFYDRVANNCQPTSDPTQLFEQFINDNTYLRFRSQNSENCYTIGLDEMSQAKSYLIKIIHRNIQGQDLRFNLFNKVSKKADIDMVLSPYKDFSNDYVIVPPMTSDAKGYAFTFNNISAEPSLTINDLKEVTMYDLPYFYLADIRMENPNPISSVNRDLVTFTQSQDAGWKLYSMPSSRTGVYGFMTVLFPDLFATKENERVFVNDWSNGWIVPQKNDVIYFVKFSPQILQVIGYICLILTFIVLLVIPLRRDNYTPIKDPSDLS